MELQQLRYVLAVAQTRSFTRAAEQWLVVESGLSQQVAKLERELGLKLFARTSRRVELTQAGAAFLPAARECLAAADRAMSEAAAAVGEVRGRLTVGAIPTVAAVDIPALLERFYRAHPQVQVALRSGASTALVESVTAGELDLAFLGLPERHALRGVQARELARDELVVVLPPGHRLAGEARISLAQLSEETFVDFPAGSPGRVQSDLAFTAAGLERDVVFEVALPDHMIGLVRRRLAVALLPATFIGTDRPGVTTVPITDGPRRVEYLVWNEFNPAPAVRAFLDLVQGEKEGLPEVP